MTAQQTPNPPRDYAKPMGLIPATPLPWWRRAWRWVRREVRRAE